jgi:hypothetical protein
MALMCQNKNTPEEVASGVQKNDRCPPASGHENRKHNLPAGKMIF